VGAGHSLAGVSPSAAQRELDFRLRANRRYGGGRGNKESGDNKMRFVSFERINGQWRAAEWGDAQRMQDEACRMTPPEIGIISNWIDGAAHGEVIAAGISRVFVAVDENIFNEVTGASRCNSGSLAIVAGKIESDLTADIQTPPPVVLGGGHVADAPDKLTRVQNASNETATGGGLFG
jgi:hypothetical protein